MPVDPTAHRAQEAPDVVVLPVVDPHVSTLPGVAFDRCLIRNLVLPRLEDPVLREVVDREVERHFGRRERPRVSFRSRVCGDRTALLIIAVPGQARGEPFPRPLWIAQLAASAGLIGADRCAVLVYPEADRFVAVTTCADEVGLMRSFPHASDPAEELYRSARCEYLCTERRRVPVRDVVLVEEAGRLGEAAHGALGADVQHVRYGDLARLAGTARMSSSPGRLAFSDGLLPVAAFDALPARIDVGLTDGMVAPTRLRRRRRGPAVMAAIAATVLPPLAMHGLDVRNQERASAAAALTQQLQPRLERARAERERLEHLQSLVVGLGPAISSAESWERLFAALDVHKPAGVRIMRLEGNTAGSWRVIGRAPHAAAVGEYVNRLAASGAATDLDLSVEDQPGRVDFELGLRLPNRGGAR